MTDITRYDINEHGELPLTNGRYVRWEGVEDLLIAHAGEVKYFKEKADRMSNDYSDGFDDGYEAGCTATREELADDSSIFHVNLGDEDRRPYSVDDD